MSNLLINKILHGDCIEVMKNIPDNTISSCITDPPYELNIMNKKWDNSGISFDVKVWKEILRIIKPGGFLFCFGGTRTVHRMVCAIEDAGWEIRDTMMWLYGSGWPKSLNISKSIDKKEGAEREVIGINNSTYDGCLRNPKKHKKPSSNIGKFGFKITPHGLPITGPSTDLAKKFDGYGTVLKPMYEPIIIAMKPIDENYVNNAEKWGIAGLNIDDCRIELNGDYKSKANGRPSLTGLDDNYKKEEANKPDTKGRWPGNVILDDVSAALLDAQTGTLKSGDNCIRRKEGRFIEHGGLGKAGDVQISYGDVGGASRFFYCAKASKREKGDYNKHSTVKPLSLIKYLCHLIKPPEGGIVLDPFLGSGTTAVACMKEGIDFIGIEKEKEYIEIAEKRIEECKIAKATKIEEEDIFS
jgi:site-specific DNA-methyltransferase (adenine-specific)